MLTAPFGKAIKTAEGAIFKIDAGSPPKITDERDRTSNITMTDIEASNGAVHVIDKVILPGDKTITDTAVALSTSSNPQFTVLVEAVTKANLGATLSGPGPFTVFAPTDAAFASLLTELGITKQQLLARPDLAKILTYHVVPPST